MMSKSLLVLWMVLAALGSSWELQAHPRAVNSIHALVKSRQMLKSRLTRTFAQKRLHSTAGTSQAHDGVHYYASATGTVVPAKAYRYVSEKANYLGQFVQDGKVVPDQYYSFDKFDKASVASAKLQVTHDGAIRAEVNTLPYLDSMRIPNGQWESAAHLEPITKDFPEFGEGGATQVKIGQAVSVSRIINLRNHETLFERK